MLSGILLVFIAHVAPEAILMSLACATTEGYGDINGPCCSRRQGWYLGSVLPFKTMLRSMAYTEVRDHVDACGSSCQMKHVEVHDLCSH